MIPFIFILNIIETRQYFDASFQEVNQLILLQLLFQQITIYFQCNLEKKTINCREKRGHQEIPTVILS